jgi:hypothetical protein
LTTDPVASVKAIEMLIRKNAQVMQAIQTNALKESLAANEATVLQLLQSVNPTLGRNVNIKA